MARLRTCMRICARWEKANSRPSVLGEPKCVSTRVEAPRLMTRVLTHFGSPLLFPDAIQVLSPLQVNPAIRDCGSGLAVVVQIIGCQHLQLGAGFDDIGFARAC